MTVWSPRVSMSLSGRNFDLIHVDLNKSASFCRRTTILMGRKHAVPVYRVMLGVGSTGVKR